MLAVSHVVITTKPFSMHMQPACAIDLTVASTTNAAVVKNNKL